jgi:MFS family permease
LSDDKARHLRVLYATIFLSATGLGTTTFLLPVYAASIGASYVDLGLMGAVGNVVYTVFTLLTGLLDRYERLRLYTGYAFMGALILASFTLAGDIPRLLIARALMGVASASFWVSASTLTADISPPERLTQSMGRYNLSWITGFAVGPYLGGLISSSLPAGCQRPPEPAAAQAQVVPKEPVGLRGVQPSPIQEALRGLPDAPALHAGPWHLHGNRAGAPEP